MENISKNDINQPTDSGNRISERTMLYHLIRHINRNWLWFGVVALIAAVAGYFYAAQKKPVYESYVSFALEGGQDKMSSAMGFANQLGISVGGNTDVFSGDNILDIIMSRRIIESTLLAIDTIDNKPVTMVEYYQQHIAPEPKKKALQKIHFLPGENRADFGYTKDSLLYKIYQDFYKNRITARRPEKNVNIYEVMVKTPDERFTKIFTDILIEKTNSFYKEISSQKARETLEILEKRVPAMKGKLDATITSRAAIEDANLNTAFAEAEVQKTKELSDSKVYAGAYAELFKNLEMARFQYLKSIPLMQIIDSPEYPMKKIKPSGLLTAVIFAVAAVFLMLVVFIGIDFIKFSRRYI